MHGKAFADKVHDGWTAMAEGLHTALSDVGAASHNAIALGLQRSYQEMAQSIRNSLREAPDGKSAWEFAQDRLVVHPSNWATMSGTLAVKAMATHVNAFRQGVKAAGKRPMQNSEGGTAAKKTRIRKIKAKKRDEEAMEESQNGAESNEGEGGEDVGKEEMEGDE